MMIIYVHQHLVEKNNIKDDDDEAPLEISWMVITTTKKIKS